MTSGLDRETLELSLEAFRDFAAEKLSDEELTALIDEVISALRERPPDVDIIMTGRDAAHKKMVDILASGERLPVDLKNRFIYYVGPVDPVREEVVGPAGPTTATRMDKFTRTMLEETGLDYRPHLIDILAVDKRKHRGAGQGSGRATRLLRRVYEVPSCGDRWRHRPVRHGGRA